MHPLHNAKGEISQQFPLTLGDMFGITGASIRFVSGSPRFTRPFIAGTAEALLKEYGLEVSDSREKNINTFMCHCGIQYQLVRPFSYVLVFGCVRYR